MTRSLVAMRERLPSALSDVREEVRVAAVTCVGGSFRAGQRFCFYERRAYYGARRDSSSWIGKLIALTCASILDATNRFVRCVCNAGSFVELVNSHVLNG